ncbi:MAG TPA: hypothetical protein VKB80_26695 [Kofleriaceae bacterium]|nr:hypothetical protein [Kofleriaceae bacterium]
MPASPRAPRPEPFAIRDGHLFLEDLALTDLVEGLDGCEAWVISHAAVAAWLTKALRGRPGTVDVADIGPREVLGQCAAAGCWARASSSHELALAQQAGFAPRRIVAGGDVVEDGFLRDALAAEVAVIERKGRAGEANLRRIAAALGHALPPPRGAPRTLPAPPPRCGGLLAPLLAGPPSLALDAAWDAAPAPDGRPVRRAPLDVLPLVLPARRRVAAATVRGLNPRKPHRARLHGPAERGEWVVLPLAEAAAVHRPDPAHPLPRVVMVRGAAWRPLEPRALPPPREA